MPEPLMRVPTPLKVRMVLYPVPTFKALKTLPATVVTLGKLMLFRVLLPLAVPVGVIDKPFTVVAVPLLLAFVKVNWPRLAPVVLRAVLDTEKIEPLVVALVTESVPLV